MARFVNGGTVHCYWETEFPVINNGRCGQDRNCLGGEALQTNFRGGYCNALAFVERGLGRYVDILTADTRQRLLRVKGPDPGGARATACHRRVREYDRLKNFETNPPDYTINIPGITDILRIPGLETKELRRERFSRMKTSVPALPRALQWIPPLINKLDDAQDLLFTGLALAWPILRLLGRPFLGPLGILLTISDLLNLGT